MRELMRGLRRLGALALPVCLVVLALPGTAEAQQAGTPFAPVAVVNGAPVTGFDLEQRMRMLRLFSDASVGDAALAQAALDQLIEDRLKIQAARRSGIEATDEMIAAGTRQFAESRGTTVEALRARLQSAGVTDLAFEDLIRAEVVWLELVRNRFGGDAVPDAAELDAQLGQIAGPSTAYRLQEIGLPAEPGREAETLAQAQALAAQLGRGADFTAAVRQYSQAPSAAQNGEIGWVDAARLPPELAAQLAELEPGEVSAPIAVGPGYSIVRVLEVRQGRAPGVDAGSPEVRAQVRRQMIEQQVGSRAAALMQELRRDALIERR